MARRQATIFINGREVKSTLKDIATEKRKVNSELRQLIIGTEEYEKKSAELRKLNKIYREQTQSLRGTRGAMDKLAAGVTRFIGVAAAAFTVDSVIQYGKQLFNLGVEMEVLAKKAQTVFGEALPLVTAAAEENAKAMGLTTTQYTAAATAIGDLLVPMGFQREEAANISTELVNLSGALSEWTGGQIKSTDVSRILSKALLGEREELKQLGIAISEADVKARLAEKGLDKLTGTLLQQAKATATLELVTEKSVDAQTAYAENAGALVRRQAEISAKVSEVSEKLATLLIPVFERLISIADNVVNLFLKIADGIGGLVDPSKAAIDSFDQQAASVADLEKNLVPLLERYDELTEKTDKSEEEQDELKKVIKEIGEITPAAVTQINKYGEALSINADASRGFLEAEKARLKFVNQEAIAETKKTIKELEELQQEYIAAVGGEASFGFAFGQALIRSTDVASDKFKEDAQKQVAEIAETLKGARAELERLTGEGLGSGSGGTNPVAEPEPELDPDVDPDVDPDRDKRIKEREKNLQRLLEVTKRYQEEARFLELNDEEQAIERIKNRYQKEIELATKLEEQGVTEASAQRLELLRLRDQEIARYELEQSEKKLAEDLARIESDAEIIANKELEETIKKAEFEEQLREELNQILLSEQELQLLQLEEHYGQLLALAEQYGLDVTDILLALEVEKGKIRKKERAAEEELAEYRIALDQEIVDNKIEIFRSASQMLSSFAQENTALATALFVFEKGVAAAQVIINLQRELSAIATNVVSTLGPLAGAPFVAALSTQAKIRAGLRLATIAGTTIQAVTQKKEGGYHNVIGQDDGRQYRARYIGDPGTGMLPPTPVVLASETGPEYFVSNRDLRNPLVMDYVRAIENIRLNRIGQRQDGGAFPEIQDIQPSSAPDPTMASLAQAVTQLVAILDSGILAVIEDDTVVGLINRTRKLQDAAGGTL